MSGLAALNGYANGPACNTGGLIPDPISGYFLAGSIVMALNHAKRTGKGQRVSGSMVEAVACTCPSDAIAEFSVNGVVRGPNGNAHPRHAPHCVYSAAGGEHEWIAVAVESDRAFAALAARMGVADVRFETEGGRKAHEAELNDILTEWCAQHDAEAEAVEMGALGVSAAKVQGFFESCNYESNPNHNTISRDVSEDRL